MLHLPWFRVYIAFRVLVVTLNPYKLWDLKGSRTVLFAYDRNDTVLYKGSCIRVPLEGFYAGSMRLLYVL